MKIAFIFATNLLDCDLRVAEMYVICFILFLVSPEPVPTSQPSTQNITCSNNADSLKMKLFVMTVLAMVSVILIQMVV